uniref:DNA/RNA-binding protein Alba-like domain-containing protein n=2 Tax=Oryza meridionalis TaxID=40149 RepID=A0A0E0CKS7_9ORYZ
MEESALEITTAASGQPHRKAASESDTMQAVREEEQVVEEVVRAGAVAEEEEGPEEKEVAMVGDETAEAEHDEEEAEAGASAKKNRIQVSTNKKPLYFYVNLAKRYMQNYDEVELSALGMAIGTVVTVAEILKNNGLATEKKILTSTIGTKDESKGRLVRKAKIEILLCKSENFNTIMSSKKSDRPKSAEEEIKV